MIKKKKRETLLTSLRDAGLLFSAHGRSNKSCRSALAQVWWSAFELNTDTAAFLMLSRGIGWHGCQQASNAVRVVAEILQANS